MENREDDDRLAKFVLKYNNHHTEDEHSSYKIIDYTSTKELRDFIFLSRMENEENRVGVLSNVVGVSVGSSDFILVKVFISNVVYLEVVVQKFSLVTQVDGENVSIDILEDFFIATTTIPNSERIQCVIDAIPKTMPLQINHEQNSYSVSRAFVKILIDNMLAVWEQEDIKLIENVKSSYDKYRHGGSMNE